MSKLHIKKGDEVIVLAGKNKNSKGKVLKVLVKEEKAIVEGVNMVSKSTKPNAQNPQGGIIKQEAPIHISNISRIYEPSALRISFFVRTTTALETVPFLASPPGIALLMDTTIFLTTQVSFVEPVSLAL